MHILNKKIIAICGIFLLAGFFMGTGVQAETGQPGGQGDPLVTKSYVDQIVSQRTAQLEAQVQALQQKVANLEAKLEGFDQGKSGKVERTTISVTVGKTAAYINDKETKLDVAPVLINGRVLAPLSFIGNALGAEFSWDNAKQQVTYTLDGQTIILKVGSKKALIDDREATLDVPAQLIKGRVLVPLSFIGTSLGAEVSWNNSTQTAIIVR